MSPINIVFICSSFEPGRDGVGDYVRQLSGELTRQGHRIAIAAFNDKYLNEEWSDSKYSDDLAIPVLRIPSIWNAKLRLQRIKQWVDVINPQWLSLQYVSFGYNKKGLPFGLGPDLKKLGRNRRWHIMLHELWVGMDKESSYKYVIWGWLQKRLIYSLLSQLRPHVIQTHAQFYQLQLQRANFDVSLLPLPSNIPVFKVNLRRLDNDMPLKKIVSFVIFGTVHVGAPIDEFANEVDNCANELGLTVELVIIGHKSSEQQRWKAIWQNKGFRVFEAGEQPPEQVSEFLSKGSFGITTTPILLIEKSSSVASMKAHGLPIICVSRPWHPRRLFNLNSISNVLDYQPGNLKRYLQSYPTSSNGYDLSEVAYRFVQAINID